MKRLFTAFNTTGQLAMACTITFSFSSVPSLSLLLGIPEEINTGVKVRVCSVVDLGLGLKCSFGLGFGWGWVKCIFWLLGFEKGVSQ